MLLFYLSKSFYAKKITQLSKLIYLQIWTLYNISLVDLSRMLMIGYPKHIPAPEERKIVPNSPLPLRRGLFNVKMTVTQQNNTTKYGPQSQSEGNL